MCGYFILKPLRDEMGTAGGVKDLKVAVDVHGHLRGDAGGGAGVLARWWRAGLASASSRSSTASSCSTCSSSSCCSSWAWRRQAVARAFYVWLSVYNLFVVSVFWSFMADLFASEQGKRLFGFIAGGGTTGIIVGLLLVRKLAVPAGAAQPHPHHHGAAGGAARSACSGWRAGPARCSTRPRWEGPRGRRRALGPEAAGHLALPAGAGAADDLATPSPPRSCTSSR